MTEISVSSPRQSKAIILKGNTVGIQLDFSVIIRIYMRSVSPQRFGVRFVRELPDLLKQDNVREILDIPEFDDYVIRESTHSPLDADLVLMKEGNVVAEFSVKASPTGNLDYIIKSWRGERRNLDLLAIIPLEGRRKDKYVFFVALIRVPKALRVHSVGMIRKFLLDVIDAKRVDEGLDRLWTTDFTELSAVARDLGLMNTLRELINMQKEILRKLDEMTEVLREIRNKLKSDTS